MVLFISCNLGKNAMFTGFLKYFTFTFLIWTYHTYNDLGKSPKSIYNESIHDNRFNLIFNRLLAKHDLHRELQHRDLKDKLIGDRLNKNERNLLGDISMYSEVKRKESNNFEAYMKDYKRRYRKKKGLFKLDCYCEKKVFDKILYVKKLSENVHNDKKRFKKIFLKKYGIGLIFFALIPALGFIYPILFGVEDWGLKGILTLCNDDSHISSQDSESCSGVHKLNWETTLTNIGYFNYVFTFIMLIVVLVFVIYVSRKVIKYEKIKAGKSKMCIN